MKKTRKIIIVILIIVTLIAVPIGGYLYYDLFVTDEIGDEYRQTWQTDDKSMTLVTDNKKGFLLQDNQMFSSSLSNNEDTMVVEFGFGANCIAYTDSNDILFEGDYSYNFITSELTIKVKNTTKKYDDMFFYKEFKLHKV